VIQRVTFAKPFIHRPGSANAKRSISALPFSPKSFNSMLCSKFDMETATENDEQI